MAGSSSNGYGGRGGGGGGDGYGHSAAADDDVEPPDELCCPLTLELFEDPVRAADGQVYERSAIEDWIASKAPAVAAAAELLQNAAAGAAAGGSSALNFSGGEVARAWEVAAAGIPSPLGAGSLGNHRGGLVNLKPEVPIRDRARAWAAGSRF